MPGPVTRIIDAISDGQACRSEELLNLLYDELRQHADRLMEKEPPGHTLQPTALVNEAYLRLVGDDDPTWDGRGHFFAAAAEAMRRILIERARKYASVKHGGGRQRVALNGEIAAPETAPGTQTLDVLMLDESLQRLEVIDPSMVEVVKLRFFAGLSVEETANVLNVSRRTIIRRWISARAWLYRELNEKQVKGNGHGGG